MPTLTAVGTTAGGANCCIAWAFAMMQQSPLAAGALAEVKTSGQEALCARDQCGNTCMTMRFAAPIP